METIRSVLRCGSIGGRLADPVQKKAQHVAPDKRKRRPYETYATAEEIEMCLNCTKVLKDGWGCNNSKFLACSRAMKERNK